MSAEPKDVVLDIGHVLWKAKTASRELAMPHALRALSATDYQHVLDRTMGQPPADYCLVNGKPYVIGQTAERYGVLTRRSGPARYTRDYYGVIVAAILGQLYGASSQIRIYASHAPGDIAYRPDLMRAVLGDWQVEAQGRSLAFSVVYVNTFDEPLGGLMNVVLAEDGVHYQRTDVDQGRSLVIDIGGGTTDWYGVQPGGETDYSLTESTPIGILEILRMFESSFRSNNIALCKGSSHLPENLIRDALATGVFRARGQDYPCGLEVAEATNVYLNRFADTFQRVAGAGLAYETIILTGGGSAMLYDYLLPILDHGRVILAAEPSTIHLANVRGGRKLWLLLAQEGLLL